MQQVRIEAESRSHTGKGVARALRRDGKLPAVVYGHGDAATSIQLDTRAFRHALVNEGADRSLISLIIDGNPGIAVVKDIQLHPIRPELLHVDFQTIRMDEEITVEVEIILQGESEGVGLGGVLEHITREVEVRVLPANIPDAFIVDITDMEIGDTIHVDKLDVPDDAELLTDVETVIVSVSAPRVEEEEPTLDEELAEGEEAQEPERVGEDDAEDGEDE